MATRDEFGRDEPPLHGDEVATVRGFLDYQRSTFDWKTRGLDQTALNTTTSSSTMTLGGMMKHLALVEEYWTSVCLSDMDLSAMWDPTAEDPDWDWHSAKDDSPASLHDLWTAAVTTSNARLDEALTRGDLSQLARRPRAGAPAPSLRWILCHLLEEYARHNGHADLLREAIDGERGE